MLVLPEGVALVMLDQVEQRVEEHLVDQVEPLHPALHLHNLSSPSAIQLTDLSDLYGDVVDLPSPEEGQAVVAHEGLAWPVGSFLHATQIHF